MGYYGCGLYLYQERRMPAKKPLSGTARMKAKGLSGFSLYLSAEQKKTIKKAAKLDGRSMTQFLIYHGVKEATRIISRNPVS